MAPLQATWVGGAASSDSASVQFILRFPYQASKSAELEKAATFLVPALGPSSRVAPRESSDMPTVYQAHARPWSCPQVVPWFRRGQACKHR